MSPAMIIGIGFLPLLVAFSIILLGRDTASNLKLLVLLIPLEAFAVIETGFTITLAYLTLLMIIISLILKGTKLQTTIFGGRIILLFWFIALIATTNGLFSDELTTQFADENMAYRAGSMRTILQYGLLLFHFALFFIIVNYIQKETEAISLLKLHLTVGFGLCCLGIVQYISFVADLPLKDVTWAIPLVDNSATYAYGEVRLYSAGVSNFSTRTTFKESLHFASYINSVLPILVALWFAKSKDIKEKFGIVATPTAAIIGIITLFLTFSRSGWGAFALSMLILVIWLAPKRALLYIPVGFSVTALVVALFAKLGFFAADSSSLIDIIAGRFELSKILLGPRAQYLLVLFDSFQHHPLLGLGAGQFAIAGASATGSEQVHSAHGILWAALADFGLIGFLLLLTFFISVLTALYKTIKTTAKESFLRPVMIGLFASISAVCFQSLFVGDRIPFYLVLLLSLSVVLIQQARNENKFNKNKNIGYIN